MNATRVPTRIRQRRKRENMPRCFVMTSPSAGDERCDRLLGRVRRG